jgi:pimeloyl-ACP methyl ester carboxylesterase
MIETKQESMSEKIDGADEVRPAILFIAGFGDNSSMFSGLSRTHLADTYRLIPLDLPGFGAPPLDVDTTLDTLAQFVSKEAKEADAEIIVAHSVASIIASIAAKQPECPITTIISLEGNITAADAYFSGTAADYNSPDVFRAAFLARLDEMAATAPIIVRYREAASQADPQALWQLGTDARRFSTNHVPGEILADAAEVTYLYNPANCPEATVLWLDENPMDRVVLDNASHWASVDQPEMLADMIAETLR